MTPERWRHPVGAALALLLLAGAAVPARAQDPREAKVGRAANEFDSARRLELLTSALDPNLGPLRGAWPVGVQLLAQTLIEEGNDSLAGIYLRWAVRQAPDLQVDTVQFLPEVATAYAAARQFVAGSGGAADSQTLTTWAWPPEGSAGTTGRLQVTAPSVGAGLRASVEGGDALQPGVAATLAPGSYLVRASAPGFDSLAVTREVLPGVTTLLELRPRRSAVAAAAPAPPPRIPAGNTEVGEVKPKKKFPIALVLGGVAAAGAVVALAGGGGGDDGGGPTPVPPTTGGISLTFPNP